MCDMQRMRLRQPDVAIHAGALIKPSLAFGSVGAHGDRILAAVVEEVRDVETKRGITAEVPSDVVSIDENHRVAEDAIEFNGDAAAQIAGRDFENATIPA